MQPGIYNDLPNEQYHAGPGISKTGLWTIHTKSAASYKYGERKEERHFDLGEAAHIAILQPNLLEQKIYRGPEDRRGNKWKDVVEFCQLEGKTALTAGDYDKVLEIRDTIHADAFLNGLITGGQPIVEASGYWTDPVTGQLCRCRPDFYREDLGILLDLKTTRSAHPDNFARDVINYGYHGQEAHYSDGWRILGKPVEGFVFLAVEKERPYLKALYETPPSIVEEGRAAIRQALNTYDECERTGIWPGYGDGVQELQFSRWSYRLTEAPTDQEEAA